MPSHHVICQAHKNPVQNQQAMPTAAQEQHASYMYLHINNNIIISLSCNILDISH